MQKQCNSFTVYTRKVGAIHIVIQHNIRWLDTK